MRHKTFWMALLTLLGNFLYALTVKFFLLPMDLMSGGTTGLGLFAQHYFHVDLSIFVFLFNGIMLLLAYGLLGKRFAAGTVLSSLSYPLFLAILDRVFLDVSLTQDLFLNTLFSGLGIGASLAIVMRAGASTGGMDIPPLILQKYFKIPVSFSLYAFDFIILLLQCAYNDIDYILYGIVLVMTYSLTLDKLLLIGTTKTEVKIVSQQSDAIRNAILKEVDRGVTMIEAQSGYKHEAIKMVYSVIDQRELVKIERIVHAIDPECFMSVARVSEVEGRGFTLKKRYE